MARTMVRSVLLLAGLAFLAGTARLNAQEREITGQVLSADGSLPLSAAVVQTLGTSFVSLSNADGGFRIQAPAGDAIIRVTLIGYRTTEVTVSAGQSSVSILMETDLLNLEGIVVTGRATSVARRNLANAVATVSSNELERAPASSVERSIQGKIAGAIIEQNSGAPGGGIQVRLRGVSTINGATTPLYVVDGVIISDVGIPSNQNAITNASGGSNPSLNQDAVVNRVTDLNPEDIERIEILKGASAAAIYGSKASNGVVLITTKQGAPGPARFNVTQRFGVFDLSNKLGMRQFETVDEAVATFGEGARDSYVAGQVFDQEELLAGRNDLSYETSASVSGGTQDTRYFVSGLWKDDAGIIDNTGFEKQSLRINISQALGDRANLSVTSNLLHTTANRGLTNNDNSGTSYYMVFPFTPNFVDLRRTNTGVFPANPFERSNPLETAAEVDNDEEVWRFFGSASLELDLLERADQSLRFIAQGGADYFDQENAIFAPPFVQFEPNDGLLGTSLLSNSNNLNANLSANLVYGWTPSDRDLSLTSSAGFQYEDTDLNVSRITSQNLNGGQENVNTGTQIGVNEFRSRIKDIGFYLQQEALAVDERLSLTAGVRADRSSANGDTDKYFWYPKAAVAYRFPDLGDAVNEAKVRFAWGQTGNRPLYGQKFTPLTTTNNIEGIPGILNGGVVGTFDLEPERQAEFEGGIDLTLFNGNGSIEATFYQRNVSDLILQRTLAPSSGFTTQFFNGGEMRVRGVELSAGATPINTSGVTWIARGTFFLNRSEVTSLPVPSFRTGGFGTSLGSFQVEEGESITQIVTNLGLNPDGSSIVGKIGDANPDFKVSFTNEITFGDFNLYGLVDWQKGGTVVNLTKLLFDFGANYVDHEVDVAPFDVGDGTMIDGPLGAQRVGRWLSGDSRPYFEDASYLKIREIALRYDVPSDVVTNMFGGSVSGLQLTASGRNLWTSTDYSGLDPEVSNFGTQAVARNIDVAPFPPSRSFWLGASLTFN